MVRTLLRSKIHRATITEANLEYVGSITIDEELMAEADITEYEKVLVVDVDNGARFETYTITGPAGSGVICVNGAAAHLVEVGHKVIIMSFAGLTPAEVNDHCPRVVIVDADNKPQVVTDAERHAAILADLV